MINRHLKCKAYLSIIISIFISASCSKSSKSMGLSSDTIGLPIEEAKGCEILNQKTTSATFVMFNIDNDRLRVCNAERAHKPFLPASTFKVPHALIALELEIIQGPNQYMKWDGRERAIPAWNRDTTLATGMANSTVWYYQETAKKIGYENMSRWVKKLGYGNTDIGLSQELTHFWLDGSLRVSALGQVEFLSMLKRRTLPARDKNQIIVTEMMRTQVDNNTSELHAKSGLVLPIDPNTGDITNSDTVISRLEAVDRIGWYVGWIEQDDLMGGDIVFAFNLDIGSPEDIGNRRRLTLNMLEANGVVFK
ncbi:penicillin-binding transpeptidase domain-containing protein [Microbulbifer epialgicus]|uniref:Beta-lactamase n=1 Tax=Microbulbifer epialgicus TaxID=393907 RepID=A0ABV4P8A4_9GAMM